MKSVDFRNDPLFLRNQFPRDGTFEMPIIRKTKLSLDKLELIGYDRLSEEETEKTESSSFLPATRSCCAE